VPFVAKTIGVPIAKIAARVMAGERLSSFGLTRKPLTHVAVKEAVFPFARFPEVDTVLGPEMKSTGEVMGIDNSFDAALVKAIMAAGLILPAQGTILLSIADRDKPEALPLIRKLATAGYKLYATEGTAAMIKQAGLPVTPIRKKLNEGHPNVLDIINDRTVNGILNTITGGRIPLRDGFRIRRTATELRIPCFTSLDTAQAALKVLLRGSQIYSALPVADYRQKAPK
jgi:carbamoyl-phosphate synthase large subunit